MLMEFIAKNTNDMPQLAIQILQEYADCRLFVLAGEIGAGKTTLVKAICEQIGVKEAVTSPTFSLVNVYEYLDAIHQKHELYHIDLYRLKSIQEAIDIGIEDYYSAMLIVLSNGMN
ncbi:MAG: tRNA (adenosine(37)-N6)-threonylcarbamoyltransferase complex ATPase subunit type 1 TsaE [Saprospiraceae bacterium]|nr:tRNA (adenosine(37)-N6)-threonylcarbamoyltransferase complex ATPase subunit type 1 TsaE [Saprospiraceae bacterium]